MPPSMDMSNSSMVEILLDKSGSKLPVDRNPKSEDSPVQLAACKVHKQVVEYVKALLARGADVSDDSFCVAVTYCNNKALDLFFTKFVHGKCQITLLELAVIDSNMEIFKMPLDQGFDREKALVEAI
ncbi:hypothetical protein PENANT_c021G04775 [Penicillium antarcticum]|uniref:Ankyrin repeat protein n=1 Tax=Penicillium antarcticum TaxID=416450 RepID=A0A1V6PZN8_9EURO|nr:hypothetical protein PENANT_c021G04775 [Penicillium antarcticum]